MEPFYAQARDRQRGREERERRGYTGEPEGWTDEAEAQYEDWDRNRRQRLEESYRQSRAAGSGSVWDSDSQARYGTDWAQHFAPESGGKGGSTGSRGSDTVAASNEETEPVSYEESRPWRQSRPDPYSGRQQRGNYDGSRSDRTGQRRHLWLKYGGDPRDRDTTRQ